MPLDDRIAQYTQEIHEKDRVDPLFLCEDPNFFAKPFYFYTDYVALSAQDCYEFRHCEKVAHYKKTILDLKDQNEALANEVDVITGWYTDHKESQEAQKGDVKQLESKIIDLQKEMDYAKKDSDYRLKTISKSYYDKYRVMHE